MIVFATCECLKIQKYVDAWVCGKVLEVWGDFRGEFSEKLPEAFLMFHRANADSKKGPVLTKAESITSSGRVTALQTPKPVEKEY